MDSSKRSFILLLVLAALIVLFGALLKFHAAPVSHVRRIAPLPIIRSPSAIIVPEARPSYGLAWSKRRYREQYASSNMANVTLTGEDDPVNERFMDVGNLAYSREFRTCFSYSGSSGSPSTSLGAMSLSNGAPDVRVTYLKRAEAFVGKVAARGLKPNFAYQLKLRGVYSDRDAFERIGYVGRWRLPGGRTNWTDEEYEQYAHKELAESYLLFDFMVTDAEGNAEREFYANSSLHVLWNAMYQRPPTASDTITQMAPRKPLSQDDLSKYASPRPNLTPQWVFGEVEGAARRRKPLGESFLPAGHYHADFALTEESFHGYADEGFWATAMKGPVEFDIVDRPREPLNWKSARLVTKCALNKARSAGTLPIVLSSGIIGGAALAAEPQLFLDETLCLPASGRYLLAGEIMTWQPSRLEISADSGQGFEERRGRYCIPFDAPAQWQPFAVEITSRVAGKQTRLLLDPGMQRGFFAVRRVGVYRISD